MADLLGYVVLVVVVGVVAVRFGMLVASRLDRLVDPVDADDPGARHD